MCTGLSNVPRFGTMRRVTRVPAMHPEGSLISGRSLPPPWASAVAASASPRAGIARRVARLRTWRPYPSHGASSSLAADGGVVRGVRPAPGDRRGGGGGRRERADLPHAARPRAGELPGRARAARGDAALPEPRVPARGPRAVLRAAVPAGARPAGRVAARRPVPVRGRDGRRLGRRDGGRRSLRAAAADGAGAGAGGRGGRVPVRAGV